MNFDALKKRAKGGSSALAKKLEDMNSTGYTKDTRLYKAGFDKSKGTGYAVVRFLPNAHGGDDFVQRHFHSFKGKENKWYNETNRKTLGNKEPDPVSISNGLYFKLSQEMNNEKLRDKTRNRKTEFYANVYVIKDVVNPDNEGKVMIMQFGQQIFKKLQAKIQPEYEEDASLDPFCVLSGANFKIKISGNEIPDFKNPGKKVLVPNYESSEFDLPSEFLDGDEDKIMEIVNKGYDLSEFIAVKDFDTLASRFLEVTGEPYNKLEDNNPINEMASKAIEEFTQASSVANHVEKAEPESSASQSDEDDDEEDSVMARFRALAEQD